MTVIINPLHRKNDTNGSTLIYRYYASFSMPFATAALEWIDPPRNGIILDPWNGSGTTTTAAFHNGLLSYGIDMNPVAVIISRARLLSKGSSAKILSLSKEVLGSKDQGEYYYELRSDPMQQWFDDNSIRTLRSLETNIRGSQNTKKEGASVELNGLNISDITCLLYVAFFRVIKKLTSPFISKNPTWIKTVSASLPKISISARELRKLFSQSINELITLLPDFSVSALHKRKPIISMGSSEKLSLGDVSIDCVMTSPPYCTRLDYAIATRPELALLGLSDHDFCELRRSMLGTTMVERELLSADDRWGRTCNHFLHKIAKHSSKGSKSYYHRLHTSYFRGLYKSISEIARVLVPGGKVLIVVRDSYYKDVHNDLPKIVEEMGKNRSLSLLSKIAFDQNSFGNINQRRHKKRTVSSEEILVLCKT